MTKQQYKTYACDGMNKGFTPFLPYKAKNGVGFHPTYCGYASLEASK